uniref:Uncharacterized protein n=1 Tax=Anguilla anguilla TaxID=7936 RepID=A0A0E9R6A9_ANGAN
MFFLANLLRNINHS